MNKSCLYCSNYVKSGGTCILTSKNIFTFNTCGKFSLPIKDVKRNMRQNIARKFSNLAQYIKRRAKRECNT